MITMQKYLTTAVLSVMCMLTTASICQDISQVSEADIALQRDYIDADLSLMLGDYNSAKDKYTSIYKQDRSNHAAAYGLARSYAASEQIEDAKKYISVAIELAPGNKWYRLWHANYYRDLGDHVTALTSYRALYLAEPTDRYFAENYAYSLLETGKTEEALAILDQYEAAVGRQELLTKKKWSIYDGQGNTHAALAELIALAEAHPKNDRLWLNAAKYADQIGDRAIADEASKMALAINPINIEAKRLSEKYKKAENVSEGKDLSVLMGDPTVQLDGKIMSILPMVTALSVQQLNDQEVEKLDAYTTAIAAAHPTSAKALAVRADVLLYNNQYEAAIPVYQKAIEIDDTKFSMYSNLLYILYRLNESANLLSTAEEAIDYFPNEVTAYYYYSRALTETGDYEEAVSMINEGSMIAGDRPELKQLMNVAKSYNHLRQGDITAATVIADQLEVEDGWAQELLGDIATQKGDKAAAIQHYERAAQLLNEPRLSQVNE